MVAVGHWSMPGSSWIPLKCSHSLPSFTRGHFDALEGKQACEIQLSSLMRAQAGFGFRSWRNGTSTTKTAAGYRCMPSECSKRGEQIQDWPSMACEVASSTVQPETSYPVCSTPPRANARLSVELPVDYQDGAVSSCSSLLSPGAQPDERWIYFDSGRSQMAAASNARGLLESSKSIKLLLFPAESA